MFENSHKSTSIKKEVEKGVISPRRHLKRQEILKAWS